jgi:hypothetical protein
MTCNSSRFAAALFAVAASLACWQSAPAHGQMVTGGGMTDFKKTFALSAQREVVRQTGCSLGANVLWPGEQAEFTFFVKPGAPLKGAVRVDVVQYGTRAAQGDIWKPIVFKIADTSTTSVNVDLPAEGGFVKVKPRIGDKLGGYALVLDLGEKGRAFGAACVRVARAEPGRERLPTYALDLPWPHERTPFVYQTFKRLGIKGARVEGGYGSIGEAHVDWAMENDIALMLCVGAANTPEKEMPLGRGRPWLNADGSMKENVKEDLAWLPSFDPEFKRYVKDVVKKHGWPKGPINAVELWNEPWEGVSISGWAADIPRYREMFTAMAQGADEARREAGLQVLIGGACSSANTRDKLFADGKDTFLPYLDFVSIHYQPLAADGAVKHAEVLHANVIARRTITVDGNADDWKDALPQGNAQTVGTSETEKAYLPFKDWSKQMAGGKVTAWVAADDKAFYFAAKVPRMDGLLRYETRDDDAFFYPEKVRDKDRELTWPAGVRRFSYRKDFDIPSGNGKHNVQIAFNVLPTEKKAWLPFPKGTMPGFCAYLDTDYEFALNKVGDAYGGGTEIFCLQRPGMIRKHFFPRQPKAAIDGGPVKGDAKLVVNGDFVECALPWSAIPEVRERLAAGQTVKFSFRVNNGDGAFELAAQRSVSKENPFAFHNEWTTHWANEVEFALEK